MYYPARQDTLYLYGYYPYTATAAADENGKAKVVSAKNLASLATDANLWKIEQALDKDGDYTFIFTNKAGKKMTVDGKNFFHSVANAPYNNGVVFEMDGEDLTTQILVTSVCTNLDCIH